MLVYNNSGVTVPLPWPVEKLLVIFSLNNESKSPALKYLRTVFLVFSSIK